MLIDGILYAGRELTRADMTAIRDQFVRATKHAAAAGFDTNEEADPDYQGKLDFEVSPTSVVAGDNYQIRIFLVNEGKKSIRINGLNVTTIRNGSRSPAPGNSQTRDVNPGQRGDLPRRGVDVPGDLLEVPQFCLEVALVSVVTHGSNSTGWPAGH